MRVLAATNRNVEEMVKAGTFRQDLCTYRLNVIRVEVPSLRERRGDIGELAAHFLSRCAAEHKEGDPRIHQLDAPRLDAASAYPGNVRELGGEHHRARRGAGERSFK